MTSHLERVVGLDDVLGYCDARDGAEGDVGREVCGLARVVVEDRVDVVVDVTESKSLLGLG